MNRRSCSANSALACAFVLVILAIGPELCRAERIDTPEMTLEFEDGWLTRWKNKETAEEINFGKADLDPASKDDHPYTPGPWWIDRDQPKDLSNTGAKCSSNIKEIDDTTVELVQEVVRAEGEVHSVQWAVRLPLDRIDAFHYPWALAPARIAAKNNVDELFTKGNYNFRGRPAQLSFHGWRHRYYIIQAKTGGLLIYVDDPDFNHRPALEFKASDDNFLISNRSIMNPPWKKSYTGCRWVIRQYTGGVNEGAQIYQNYLARTYKLVPLKDRPTGWVQDLAFCVVKPGMTTPLPFEGNPNSFNYSSNWEKSIAYREQCLKNLSRILDPNKVMFYDTDWNYSGMETVDPNHSINPFFAYTVTKLRQMGFHQMLHFSAHFAYDPSVGFKRFIQNQWLQQGKEEEKPGLFRCALRNTTFISNKEPGPYYRRQGVDFPIVRYIMTPANEGWRRIFVAMVVSAVKATGSDMIHIDVPSIDIELHNDRYGMNIAQGLREEFKLLRETLDENGLEHVAIATELTPSEPIMAYVDMAQNSRDNSARDFLNLLKLTGEDLPELQADKEEAEAKKRREEAAKAPDRFDVEKARRVIANSRRLGEPSIDAMVIGPYVQGYPHLGANSPTTGGSKGDPNAATHNNLTQSLKLWYSMSHDVLMHENFSAPAGDRPLMDYPNEWVDAETVAKRRKSLIEKGIRKNGYVLSKLQYVKFALARFWQETSPQLMQPKYWKPGDIARFQLKDGRELRVFRFQPLVMRFAFKDGTVLADLDVFEGWKNHQKLLEKYEPLWLRNQIDEFATP